MTLAPSGSRLAGQGAATRRYLPIGYYVAALLVVVLVLPTVLRPPPDRASQSAELSPDAPPDEQQSIIESLNRGSTGTAGAGVGTGAGEGVGGLGDGGGGGIGPGPAPIPARGCRFGYGNPPLTTSSPYAAQCVPVWTGDNGGATSKGVTATEVRIVVGNPNGDAGTDGPVPTEPRPNESAIDRTWRVLQTWFNTRYNFYGRQMRLYVQNLDESPESQRAAATVADDQYNVFAAVQGRWTTMTEYARRGIVAYGEDGDQYTEKFLAAHHPYNWIKAIDSTRAASLSAEYICKKLWGKNATFAGDPLYQGQKRVLGIIYNDNNGYRGVQDDLKAALKSGCGADVATSIGFQGDIYGFSDPSTVSTAVSRLRQAGVTTIVQLLDMDTTGMLTYQADSQGYNPEWFITGVWLTDKPTFVRLFINQKQWSHAFGITAREIDDLPHDRPGYRAYKEIDSTSEPDDGPMCCFFEGLEEIANGIQLAGPNLTPETYAQGLYRLGRRPSRPAWIMAGGYGPNDHSYADSVSEIWWSVTATGVGGQPGAYMYVRDGQRYDLGEIPREDALVFREGTSSGDLRRSG